MLRFLLLWLVVILACEGKPPNIVFMVADDLGWNDVSWHNPGIKTPNLEHLAKTGIILNQSYVQPMCSPSRSAFMSGYYPYHTGMQHTVIMAYAAYGLPYNLTTLPQKLKEAGYKTHIVGKWHQGFCNWKYTPTYRGFDSFFGYYIGREDHYTHWVDDLGPYWNALDFRMNKEPVKNLNGTYGTYAFTKRAVDIIKTHDKADPLFLYYPFQNVHSPLEVPKQYEDMYAHIKNRPRRIFSGMVTMLDEAVGNVTSALKEAGLYEDTIILFTTDNGGQPRFAGNNWPLRGAKTTLWEGGTRGVAFVNSPLLKKSGYAYEGLIHAADWFPSILSIASLKSTDNIDGVSFWENVQNNKKSTRNSFIYNIDDIFKNGAIRDGNYKLIVGKPGTQNDWYPLPKVDLDGVNSRCDGEYYPGEGLCIEDGDRLKSWPFNDVKLYDLSVDPTERHDLRHVKPDVVNKMLDTFKTYLKTLVPGHANIRVDKSNPNKYFGGIWSPGWC